MNIHSCLLDTLRMSKYEDKSNYIFLTLIIILILLSFININNYFLQNTSQNKVLGLSTAQKYSDFWKNFLETNPNYIPGLIEIGDLSKAAEVDPNYLSK